jgi:hypothetical protein
VLELPPAIHGDEKYFFVSWQAWLLHSSICRSMVAGRRGGGAAGRRGEEKNLIN